MNKKVLFVIVACIAVIGDGLFCFKLYKNHQITYEKVYVASHQITQRTKISQDDLICIELPKEFVSDDVYVCKEDIIDKYVKLGYSIPKDSLIYKTAIEDDIKDLANTLLNKNEVNYDLYVSDIKMNTANLGINMYIDLYLTINENKNLLSDLLLSNVRITGLYDVNNKPIKNYDNDSKVYIVSVAINKDYVSILNKAKVLGELSSVINNSTYNQTQTCKLNHNSSFIDYFE